jgi:hypothetical protein
MIVPLKSAAVGHVGRTVDATTSLLDHSLHELRFDHAIGYIWSRSEDLIRAGSDLWAQRAAS